MKERKAMWKGKRITYEALWTKHCLYIYLLTLIGELMKERKTMWKGKRIIDETLRTKQSLYNTIQRDILPESYIVEDTIQSQ